MEKICEQFAIEYHIRFNRNRSYHAIMLNVHMILLWNYLKKQEIVDEVVQLVNFVYNKLWKKNTTKIAQNIYCSSNSILNNFSMLYSIAIKKLHNTFCMNVYSRELLELSNKYWSWLISLTVRLCDIYINYHIELTTSLLML